MRALTVTIILTIFTLQFSCKTTRTLTPYSELTGFEKGKVIRNEIIGFADTTLVILSGHITNNNGEPQPITEILITKIDFDKNIRSNLDGDYQIYIEPGDYDLTFQLAGMDTIQLKNLVLISGEVRRIDVSLGKAATHTHYLMENKK